MGARRQASSLDMQGLKIQNLGTPTASNDAAHKAYVDSRVAAGIPARLGEVSEDVSYTDANNLRRTGWFKGNYVVNAPAEGWFYFEVNTYDGSSWVYQRATGFGGEFPSGTWERTCSGGAWTPWVKLVDKQYVDNATAGSTQGGFFPGFIMEDAGATPPTGWLACDGSAVSRTTYAALFARIGTTYGAGNGSTTFNLPDRRERVGVGKGSSAEFNTLGKTGGAKTHTLSVAEMPVHDHAHYGHTFEWGNRNLWSSVFAQNAIAAGGAPPSNNLVTSQGSKGYATTLDSGGGLAHNNLQPYITVNYIIKT